jgi:DNA invertase Pin-like site-specific DNA recombinase
VHHAQRSEPRISIPTKEFEREIIKERTKAGLEAARSKDRYGGPRFKLTPKQVEIARKLYADKSHSLQEICDSFGIGRTTLWWYVKPEENKGRSPT